MKDVLSAHRAFYDAIEAGDADLMHALWVDADDTLCVHPGATVLQGTAPIVRSWTVLMASTTYIQFFLTDVVAVLLADGHSAVVTCTENILSGAGLESADQFAGGRVTSTSVLVYDKGAWRFRARHASPILEMEG